MVTWVAMISGCPMEYSCVLLTHGYKEVTSMFLIFSPEATSWCNLTALVRPPKKASRGSKRFNNFQSVKKLAELWVVLDLIIPLAFPHDVDVAPPLSQVFLFTEGGFLDLSQCSVEVRQRNRLRFLGKHLRHPCHRQPLNSYAVGRWVTRSQGS